MRILGLIFLIAACSTPAPAAPARTPEPFVPTLEPIVYGSGVITFGREFDPETLTIPQPRTEFTRGVKQIAWSAEFVEQAGATSLTIVLARVRASGAEELIYTGPVEISNPTFAIFANSADLAGIVDRKAGTYVLRYLRGAVVLAEGQFRLVK